MHPHCRDSMYHQAFFTQHGGWRAWHAWHTPHALPLPHACAAHSMRLLCKIAAAAMCSAVCCGFPVLWLRRVIARSAWLSLTHRTVCCRAHQPMCCTLPVQIDWLSDGTGCLCGKQHHLLATVLGRRNRHGSVNGLMALPVNGARNERSAHMHVCTDLPDQLW
jgi:hypothetical protein